MTGVKDGWILKFLSTVLSCFMAPLSSGAALSALLGAQRLAGSVTLPALGMLTLNHAALTNSKSVTLASLTTPLCQGCSLRSPSAFNSQPQPATHKKRGADDAIMTLTMLSEVTPTLYKGQCGSLSAPQCIAAESLKQRNLVGEAP